MKYDYLITSGLVGAPKVELTLASGPNGLDGNATVSWTVSPPVNFKIPVKATTFNITQKVNGFYAIGGQAAPGGPCFGATIVTDALGKPGKGSFWWVDTQGLHESEIVPANPAGVREPVAV
jgi:hypothetical protein